MHDVLIEVEFLSDLGTREVEPHEVDHQHPALEGVVAASEDRARQVINAPAAALALVALLAGVLVIEASTDHTVTVAERSLAALRPSQIPQLVVALLIAHQVLDLQLHKLCYHGDEQVITPQKQHLYTKTPERLLSLNGNPVQVEFLLEPRQAMDFRPTPEFTKVSVSQQDAERELAP